MKKQPAKPKGRPKIDNPADQRLPVVRVTKDQLKAYRCASEASGGNFSAWVRRALDKAASDY